jgi:hypothetical protein
VNRILYYLGPVSLAVNIALAGILALAIADLHQTRDQVVACRQAR